MAAPGSPQIKRLISDIALSTSGSFYARSRSIKWIDEIKESIAAAYPETSIEESVEKIGLTREIITPTRINSLRRYCKKKITENVIAEKQKSKPKEYRNPDVAEIEQYWEHPYVKQVSGSKTLIMKDTFYNEVSLLDGMSVEELLSMYEIDASMLCTASLWQIRREIQTWNRTEEIQKIDTMQIIRIQIKRNKVLEENVAGNFEQIRQAVGKTGPAEKQIICRQLSGYPTSLNHPCGYSLREILSKSGISKTTYYKALGSKSYGLAEKIRRERDARDLAVIINVMEYKGFKKGIKQIYMMMPDVAGEQFAISKIRRLLRSAGIRTKVRGENPARKRAREFHERNTKPNLLRREFRLHRPNEVRLTDVTYLDYGHTLEGEKQRAYGSSCIDPVTGKLLAFNISRNNDVQLAMETLARLSEHPTMIGALFHSDQGILYLTDEFQTKVAEMGMVQSMSKRGNCWDNAPQESFFGHFKDECDYEKCESFEELQAMIDEYAYYYNNERHQWGRNRMTPIQYEAYMEAMTEEEFEAYMETERIKYAKMKEKAEKKAIERAKTLGV